MFDFLQICHKTVIICFWKNLKCFEKWNKIELKSRAELAKKKKRKSLSIFFQRKTFINVQRYLASCRWISIQYQNWVSTISRSTLDRMCFEVVLKKLKNYGIDLFNDSLLRFKFQNAYVSIAFTPPSLTWASVSIWHPPLPLWHVHVINGRPLIEFQVGLANI